MGGGGQREGGWREMGQTGRRRERERERERNIHLHTAGSILRHNVSHTAERVPTNPTTSQLSSVQLGQSVGWAGD